MAVCTLVEVSFCVVYSRSLVEHAILKVDAGVAFLRTFFGDMIAGGWGSLSTFSDPTRRFPLHIIEIVAANFLVCEGREVFGSYS